MSSGVISPAIENQFLELEDSCFQANIFKILET